MNEEPVSRMATEEKYQLIVESARDYAIFTLDSKGRITSWNRGAQRVLGYTKKEILGKSGHRLFTPADRKSKAPEKELSTALKHNRSEDERWHVRKNGTRFWASGVMMAIRGEGGQFLGFLKILRDMTQQKLAEAAERRFTTLVQNVHDYAIMLLDAKGRISEWNEGAARLKGYTAEEVVGRHFRIFYTREDQRRKQPEAELRVASRKGRSEAEGWRVRKNGSRFWVNEIVTPIRDKANKVIAFAKISRDLTERREAEDALRMMNDSLERRVQERTAEMENYQSRLRSLALRLSKTQEEERQRIAEDIHDNLAQLLALCQMRLSVVKKLLNDGDSDKAVVDIQKYIDQAIKYARSLMLDLSPPVLRRRQLLPAMEWLAQQMETHGLKTFIRDDCKSKPVNEEVFIALFQGVRELLFNVLKHARTDRTWVSLKCSNSHVTVEVKDNGCGFDSTAQHSGGFGLFAIQERLRQVGGSLEFNSVIGRGTRVRLTASLQLPRRRASRRSINLLSPDRRLFVAGDGEGDEPIRVLIVDDHKMMRDGLRKIVEGQSDIEIVGEAVDGDMAVAMASKLKPHVVLMDVNMPKADGIEATRRITSRKSAPAVIGLSIHEDKDTEQSLRRAGACAYLSKRETADKLYSTIRRWANGQKKLSNK